MQNDPLRYFKYTAHNCVISVLAITSLLLMVTGCDSTIKNKSTVAVTDTIPRNQPTINHQAPPIEAKALTSTPEGIAEVVTANN